MLSYDFFLKIRTNRIDDCVECFLNGILQDLLLGFLGSLGT